MINEFVDRIFFTDGACSGNPGPGSFAMLELDNYNGQIILNGVIIPSENTTNNREELKAILYTIKNYASKEYKIAIYSDSAYSVNLINDWMWTWANNNWKNSKGKVVENLDLVKEVYELCKIYNEYIDVIKVRGHNGLIGNELVDSMASGNKTKYLTLCRKNNIKDFEFFST